MTANEKRTDIGLIAACILQSWQRATADLGWVMTGWEETGYGLEARIVVNDEQGDRFVLVKWFVEDGIVVQGNRHDIQSFHDTCASMGLNFDLGNLSLCG